MRSSIAGMITIGLAVISLCLVACGGKQPENPYGSVIAGLGDEDAYGILAMDYASNVLVASDMLYDEGAESQAAIYCDVYYYRDGQAKKAGTVMSAGTAYPISFSNTGIFAASGHSVEKYVLSEKDGMLHLEKGVYENFDDSGNPSYTCAAEGLESPSTQEEYEELMDEYGESQIIHFSYGASECVNEIREK